jgi:gentisate 1,2-dioxygenase
MRQEVHRMSSPSPTQSDLARAGTLQELYGLLDKVGMGAGWNKPTPSLWPEPRKTFMPAHWKYELARGALDAAGRLINTELAERRNLILFNPVQGNSYGTVRTLVAAYQMIMPGEWARVHRHTPNALRLILDALPGTYTKVDGINIAMEPGDVLLTPNWSTHGHGNRSKACAYWLDFLDAPLVQLLEPMFFEVVDEADQADERDEADVQAAAGGKDRMSVPPTTDQPFVFTFKESLRRLAEAKPEPDEPLAKRIELGHPALATTALYMMQLGRGARTAAYRTTANNIYAVVQGAGATTVDGDRFEWRRGDVVAAPAWRPHWHEASSDAILFRVTDEPVMQRFGWWREERPAAESAQPARTA